MPSVKLDIWPSTITRGYGLGKDRAARVVRRGRVTGLTDNDKTSGDAAIDAVESHLAASGEAKSGGHRGTYGSGIDPSTGAVYTTPHIDYFYHHKDTDLPLAEIRATRSLDAGATGALVDLVYHQPRLPVDLTRDASEQAIYRARQASLQWYQTSRSAVGESGGPPKINLGGLPKKDFAPISLGLGAFGGFHPLWASDGASSDRPNGEINFKPNPGTGGERVFDVPVPWSFIVPTVLITLPTILERPPSIEQSNSGISSFFGSLNSNAVKFFSDKNTFGAKTLRLVGFSAEPVDRDVFYVKYTAQYNPYTWQYQTVDFVDGEWVVHHVDMGPLKSWQSSRDGSGPFALHVKQP